MTKKSKIGKVISVVLFALFLVMVTFGIVFYNTDFQKTLWITANTLFLYGIIILYLFSTRPGITFWKMNAYFGIGWAVWSIPISIVLSELNTTIAYTAGAVSMVIGVSIAIFSFWADKKGIKIA
ncbi:MAG: hypothetical protein ACOC40_03090 [Thermoplasmatota archaeon]